MEMCQVQRLIGIPSTVKVDNDIYFHESYGNRIFKYSLEDEKLVCLAQSDCSPGKRLEYMGVSKHKDKIYFFPYYAKRICIFDFQSFSVDYKDCEYRYITRAINCEGKIFFWSNDQNIIIWFDIEKDIQREIQLPDGMCLNAGCGGGIEVDGKLYIPAKEGGRIFCVDASTLTVKLLTVPDENMTFETIDFDGDNLWLSGTEKRLVRWNLQTESKAEYVLGELEDRKIEIPWESYFYSSRIFGEYIYFAPFKAERLVRLHMQSGKLDYLLKMHENEMAMLMEVWNDYLYFSCKSLEDGMAMMDCLIDASGCVVKEKILFGESNCNLVIKEHNEDSLRIFIQQIKGEHNEENYFM